MNIIHLASELHGGAGLAALKLHRCLLEQGHDSNLVYGSGSTSVPQTRQFTPTGSTLARYADRVADQAMWNARAPGASLFTRTRRFVRGGFKAAVGDASVIHLHWIAKWLDWPSLFEVIPSEMPVVLTLHDASFFAGGCHQTNGCEKFRTRCVRCPQLKRSFYDHAARGFRVREECLRGRRIHAVPNSRWMASHAAGAKLLEGVELHEPIHPGIDTVAFRPLDRKTCRGILHVPEDKFVLCAGSAELSDTNKGMAILLEAIGLLPQQVRDEMALLVYGAGALPQEVSGVRIYQTGAMTSERLLSTVYSAADVYVTPSQMETFGMTAAEAGACGLPVICFATGGLQEIVADGGTGWLVDLADGSRGLARAIEAAHKSAEQCVQMGENGRRRVVENFEIRDAAAKYADLYERVAGREDARMNNAK
jgi:glycosyltransferase involved in cell wall biosynthesis